MRRISFSAERALLVELVLQRDAVDELHHEVRRLRVLLDGVDGDDVLIVDGGGGPGLADEALAGRAVGGVGRRQHLDGDDAVQLLVERLEHDAEAALADDLEHLVMAEPAEVAGLGGRLQIHAIVGDGARPAVRWLRPRRGVGGIRRLERERVGGCGCLARRDLGKCRLSHEVAGRRAHLQQRFETLPQRGIVGTRLVEERAALGRALAPTPQ